MFNRFLPILFTTMLGLSMDAVAALPQAPQKKQADVVIYSAPSCGYCDKAKKLFDEKNISYKIVDVQWKKDLIDDMEKKTGKRSVPQILINGEHIGGYSSLVAMDFTGELDDVLFKTPDSSTEQTIEVQPVNTTQ